MSLAFHLMAHSKPEHLGRLLNAIWHPENLYVIHYDKRRPAHEHRAVQDLANRRPNVIIQQAKPILWGRFSLFAAQYEGLKIALSADTKWSHWINLSGQCYPLANPQAIIDFHRAHNEVSFVRYFNALKGGDWKNPEQRLIYYYIDQPWFEWWVRLPGLGRRLRSLLGGGMIPRLPVLRRALPETFTWYGGDNWVTLSRKASRYVVESPESARITQALRYSALPEESLFQTILLNSPLAGSIANDHKRLINWNGRASPDCFTDNDWPRLSSAAKQGCLFARKFDALKTPSLMAEIDRSLLGRP